MLGFVALGLEFGFEFDASLGGALAELGCKSAGFLGLAVNLSAKFGGVALTLRLDGCGFALCGADLLKSLCLAVLGGVKDLGA